MNAVATLSADIWAEAKALDKLCSDISPGLLFFDAFEAKIPDSNMDAEKEFWYAVVNLYGLFVDCAPYVWRSHDQFARRRYTSDQSSGTLIHILVAHGCMKEEERVTIWNYVNAIQTLRHCFCHNMPISEFDPFTIKKGIGEIPGNWRIFPYLDKYNHKPTDYTAAVALLRSKTKHVFAMLTSAITQLSKKRTDQILDDWTRCIIAWYLQSDEVLNRSMTSYYHSSYSKPGGLPQRAQVRQWKDNLFRNVERKSRARGIVWEDFIKDWIEELTINASCAHSKATAELILPDFFDEVLF